MVQNGSELVYQHEYFIICYILLPCTAEYYYLGSPMCWKRIVFRAQSIYRTTESTEWQNPKYLGKEDHRSHPFHPIVDREKFAKSEESRPPVD